MLSDLNRPLSGLSLRKFSMSALNRYSDCLKILQHVYVLISLLMPSLAFMNNSFICSYVSCSLHKYLVQANCIGLYKYDKSLLDEFMKNLQAPWNGLGS